MTLATAVFERIGVRVRPEELERLIQDAITKMVPARAIVRAQHALPPAEAAMLARAGMRLEPRDLGPNDPIVRAAAAYAAILATSLTVQQAAQKLGVDPSRIRHRLADRTLYGIRLPSGWRIPSFQFTDGQLVPGVAEVIRCLPEDLHPLVVYNWFTSPKADLVVGDEETPVTPIEWLMLGGDPKTVSELAEQIGWYA